MICWYKFPSKIDGIKRNLFFLGYTHINNFNRNISHLASQSIMEPKDVATLKHLSEELQNDREILLHAAALSERDFEGDGSAFPRFFPRILKHVCNRKQMHYLDILRRHELIWIQFQKHSPEKSGWWIFKILFFILFGSFFFGSNFVRRSSPGDKDFCDEARRLRSAAAMVRRHPNSRQCPKGKSNAPVIVQLALSW